MADRALFPLWNPDVPFPSPETMPDLDAVTHVAVERAQPGGFHYLHESALAWHDGAFHLCWANHPVNEVNDHDELIRGRCSRDGLAWEPATVWAAAPLGGASSYNHPVLSVHDGRLWVFFTRWDERRPSTDIFTLAEGAWRRREAVIPGFLPFTPPRKLPEGHWIIGGELFWYEAAVAISRGDDFTTWEVVQIPRPDEVKLLYPETTLMHRQDELLAICRPHEAETAPVAASRDGGRSWTPLQPSNFPLAPSKPLCGMLSSGQQFLVSNHLQAGRPLLSIAVTRPGGALFEQVWKVRHQQFPRRRLFGGYGEHPTSMVGQPTEWSYPAAVEHDRKLYLSYTQGKEDCALSVIPLSALAA
ncbi:MAG: exo-alpha-sialidase [Armatimonadota bacterium]